MSSGSALSFTTMTSPNSEGWGHCRTGRATRDFLSKAMSPRPGTFEACSLANRLDYILVSPELAALATAGGINRRGLWGNPKKPPTKWDVVPPITRSVHAASDHAAVWVEFGS